ncbi:GMC family oxidoreductase [Leptolyngbya sp. CCNP1308]|uniref:GMC family oxidoreductase n=1 Tax=Leptolyngbya sp. CCNP1308 TaxID=3110255 RepID=UPI002B1FC2D2|nr:GMC family oxidoreductase [Leptolyngbya sp. CCNP1308]MEA5452686.1 GMC family oxidoreductase [Leptolyngbya sp. CCNP1308]
MIVDSREISENQVVESDICIIGSGPAGVTLAREFIGTTNHVCLLESGGISQDAEIQDLSHGYSIGEEFLPLKDIRNRQFGGNSNIWSIKLGRKEDRQWKIGVRYVPLDDIDFEKRDWVPHSGWPIRREELIPYYEKAQQVAHSGPFSYGVDPWADPQAKPFDFANTAFTSKVFQFGTRTVFHQNYLEELRAAPNVDIYLYATAVELDAPQENKAVQRVRVSNLTGKSYWIEAKTFVLATGGIETARLMLASNRHQLGGVGNENDLVGRFFMDHPLLDIGRLTPGEKGAFAQTAFYDLRQVKGSPVMGHIAFTKKAMVEQQLLNNALVLFPRPSERQTQAVLALKDLIENGYLNHPTPQHWPAIAQKLLKVAGGLDYVARVVSDARKYDQSLMHGFGRGGWSESPQIYDRFKTYEVLFVGEQAPDPANRVQLSRDRDPLGMPRVELNWRWGRFNIDDAQRTQDLFAAAAETTGLGRYVSNFEDGELSIPGPAGMAHHLGTTRMSSDPNQGIVNENCQVHSVPNLYIASSSVFPTGGYANPTLTILALTLRLADHLKKTLPKKEAVVVQNSQGSDSP